MRARIQRWARWTAVACSVVAAGILAPTIMIWIDALMKRDAHATYVFAMQIAEPVALIAAVAVTFLGARRFAVPGPVAADEGASIGALAAALVFGAALWVHDLDVWTVAAAALLPLSGFAGGWQVRHGRRQSALASHSAPASLGPPPPDLPSSPARGTNTGARHY